MTSQAPRYVLVEDMNGEWSIWWADVSGIRKAFLRGNFLNFCTRTLKPLNWSSIDFLVGLRLGPLGLRAIFGSIRRQLLKIASIFAPGKFPWIPADHSKRETKISLIFRLATCAFSAIIRFSDRISGCTGSQRSARLLRLSSDHSICVEGAKILSKSPQKSSPINIIEKCRKKCLRSRRGKVKKN